MDIKNLLARLAVETRNSATMEELKTLLQTVLNELQATQEQLSQAKAKIKALEDELRKLRKLPKRPEFRSEPIYRNNGTLPSHEPDLEKISPKSRWV